MHFLEIATAANRSVRPKHSEGPQQMRMMLMAVWFVVGAAEVANGQSTGPALAAYESLPISQETHESHLTAEPAEPFPPSTVVPAAPIVGVELLSQQVDLAGNDVELACHQVDCGDGVLAPLGSESFWFGSLELTMMAPSVSSPIADMKADGFVAPRGTVGWESSRNLGVRGRFWGADADTDLYVGGSGPIGLDVQPTRIDFDVYRRFLFDDSSVIVGGGVTAAEMEFEIADMVSFHDRGAGVQFFVEGRHRLTRSSVADTTLFARGRWAGLTGEWESPLNSTGEGDSHMDILEAAIGVEWRRRFTTADLILQFSMESQSWDATYTEKVDFIGSVFSIGFAR